MRIAPPFAIGSFNLIFSGILLSGIAIGQDVADGPRIKCATEIFDYGYVPQNVIVSHTFWLRNTGTEQVKISQIKPNCGCTQIPPTDSTIAVGDSLPVEVLFGSRVMSGKVEKFTRIISNAEGRVPALTFRARVLKKGENPGAFSVTPLVLEMGQATEAKIALKNTGNVPLKVAVVDLPHSLILLDTKEMSLEPDESKEIGFSLIAQTTQKDYTKSITLEANDPARTRITVAITNVQKE
jgi:hypothetical protein